MKTTKDGVIYNIGNIHYGGDLVIGDQEQKITTANGKTESHVTKTVSPDGSISLVDKVNGVGVELTPEGEFAGYTLSTPVGNRSISPEESIRAAKKLIDSATK